LLSLIALIPNLTAAALAFAIARPGKQHKDTDDYGRAENTTVAAVELMGNLTSRF
jgi:hypothetical protein